MMHANSEPARLAALDLGSLTVRLAIAERTPTGDCRIVLHQREITGLGRGLAQTGELAPEGMEQTFQVLDRWRRVLADYQVAKVRIVATHAVRAAANGQVFLARLKASLGLSIEVLSPSEEARLSLAGVLSVLAPAYLQAPVLVFDVGGGSSEWALVRPGQEAKFASLPLGVLTLSQAHPVGDPPAPDRVAALHQEIAQQLSRFREQTFGADLTPAPRLVGTAGAVTTLAAMQLKLGAYDPNLVNNLVMARTEVAALAGLIARLPEAERAGLPGLEPAKAGVMVAGALIILAILEVFGQDSLVVIDAGLLEGVLKSFEF